MTTELFGCNTYSYIRTERAADCVARLVAHGFREFELMAYPGHLWADMSKPDLAGLRALFTGGVRLTTLNMPNVDINVAAAAAEMRRYSLAMLADVVRLAGELGAPGVVIGPGKANPLFPAPAEELVPHFFAALDVLCPIAEAVGTALWVENMPFAFLPGIDDTGRQHYRHDPVGHGDVPFAAIPAMLRDIGYAGRPMLEIISTKGDADILDSAARLARLGFRAPGEAS